MVTRDEWLKSLPERYPQPTLLDGAYIRADIVEQMIDDAVEEYRQHDLACWEAHVAVTKLLNSQERRVRPREDVYDGTLEYRK